MKYSGLYHVANPSAQLDVSTKLVRDIVSRIETKYPRATHLDNWTLNHRLLRDIPPASSQNAQQAAQATYSHTYNQLLSLSYLAKDRTYNLIHPPASTQDQQNGASQISQASSMTPSLASILVSIPSDQLESFYRFLINIWTLLWSPQRTLDTPQGVTYKIGLSTIYIGELRSKRQANILSPGIIVCISTVAGGADDEPALNDPELPALGEDIDFSYAQDTIRELWRTIKEDVNLGKGETREYMQAAQDTHGDEEKEREAAVRMWCEALRSRG